jgi:membrane-associated phospholipid phosphatase
VVYPLTFTAVLVVAVSYRRWAEATLVAVALLSGQSLRALTNRLVDRPRPPHADWLINASGRAWPSGHTATAVLTYGLLVTLFWPILTRAVIRVAAVAAATLIALAVGLSRVYLGVHWPSDVLGGWTFGALWLTIAVTAISAQRSHARPPRSTSWFSGAGLWPVR